MADSRSLSTQTKNFHSPGDDPQSRAALDRCAAWIEPDGLGFEIASSHAPDADERACLSTRRAALTAALAPGTLDEVGRVLARLFEVMPSASMSDGSAVTMVGRYAKVLASEPMWSITAACNAVIRAGEKFRPGAPELLSRALQISHGFRAELWKIERLLFARVRRTESDEARQRVLAGFRALSAGLAALPPSDREAPRDAWEGKSPEAYLVELGERAKTAPPMRASAELLKPWREQRRREREAAADWRQPDIEIGEAVHG